AGDFARRVEADVAFHIAIYRLSGNPAIEETARPQWIHFRRAIQAALAQDGVHALSWRQHKAIFKAIRAGDAVAAERLALHQTETPADRTAARLKAEQPQQGGSRP